MFARVIIRSEILCIGITLYLIGCCWYCSKYHHDRSNFLCLALSSLFHSIFAIVTEVTVNMQNCPSQVNYIVHIIFYSFALLFCLELFRYALSLVLPVNKVKIPTLIATLICVSGLVIACVAPMNYRQGKGTAYSYGIGTTTCYLIGVCLFVAVAVILIFNRKKIQEAIVFAILPITCLAFIGMIVQIFVPEFLFTPGT